jgi:5-aminolevulinate synthase
VIDFIRSFGSGFIFTTSLPPAICAAAERSIQLIRQSAQQRIYLKGNVAYLRSLLAENGLPFTDNASHITPLPIAGAERCKRMADLLLRNHGVYVQPVNFPTVPVGEECLRVIVTSRHTREQIVHLVKSLKQIRSEINSDYLPEEPSQSVTG